MADIQPLVSGKGRRKLSTPRIDLTPMVDLGFLLITFFMYTTTLARPKVMELQMPFKEDLRHPTEISAEATIVLLPCSAHRVAYYQGTKAPGEELHWCTFNGPNSLRNLMRTEATRTARLPQIFSAEAHKLHVIIKPDTSAAYDDIVGCLDEMTISEVPYYAIMRISSSEQEAIQKIPSPAYGK